MTDGPLELRTSRSGNSAVIDVVGEIDLGTAPRLEEAIRRAQQGVGRVVVDLSRVGFLDSSALNVLVQSRRELAVHDVAFRIVVPSDLPVRRIFEIAHLTDVLELVELRADALA